MKNKGAREKEKMEVGILKGAETITHTHTHTHTHTGWCDVDINKQGEDECKEAGMLLASLGYEFDEAHTSVLKRYIDTHTHTHNLSFSGSQTYIHTHTHTHT